MIYHPRPLPSTVGTIYSFRCVFSDMLLDDAKTAKFNGRTSAGEYWVIHAVKSFRRLSKDKEICGIFDREEEANEVRANAWEIVKSLDGVCDGDTLASCPHLSLFRYKGIGMMLHKGQSCLSVPAFFSPIALLSMTPKKM